MKTRDANGVYYKFPDRTCKDCLKYPCLDGMDKLFCDLAAYGCKYYTTKITEDAADNTTC